MTCVVDGAVGMKLPVVALEDLLNEHINLSDYGTGIQKIFFIFIAVSPKNKIHKSHVIHTESEAHVEIALKLDYEKVLEAEGDELMSLLQVLFLNGINLCQQSNLADFKWDQLFADTKELFRAS